MDNEKKGSKRRIIIIAVIVAVIVVIAAVIAGVASSRHKKQVAYVEKLIEQPIAAPQTDETEEKADDIDIDFDRLKTLNPDIYAWIDIPGTAISYPVLQHETDDAYYLTHDYDKASSYNGAIFSQKKYNGTEFKDKCTVLYGHKMRNGSMFAGLADYMDRSFFDEHDKFYIYTPYDKLEYEVFASIPFDKRNILYTWDCTSEKYFASLVRTIMNTRSVDANIKDGYKIDFYNDKIVILSTCYPGDNTRRYLVAARLTNQPG